MERKKIGGHHHRWYLLYNTLHTLYIFSLWQEVTGVGLFIILTNQNEEFYFLPHLPFKEQLLLA